MADFNKIMERIKSDYEYVSSLGHTVLGVFLQGSQNYNLDYEGSDIDTKCIILPSFEDFCLNRRPVSTTLVLPSNEHIDLKDVRLMHDCFRKQNINFIEILFTKYRYINPLYADIYQVMLDNAEKIAHYNNYAAVNCIAGMVYEKRKALTHRYEGLAAKIDAHGYDNKQLHHILRCEEFLKRYINGVPYAECLIPTHPADLVEIKAKYIYNKEQAEEIADNCVVIVDLVKDKYRQEHECVIDNEVDVIMNKVLINLFTRHFKIQIMSNEGGV